MVISHSFLNVSQRGQTGSRLAVLDKYAHVLEVGGPLVRTPRVPQGEMTWPSEIIFANPQNQIEELHMGMGRDGWKSRIFMDFPYFFGGMKIRKSQPSVSSWPWLGSAKASVIWPVMAHQCTTGRVKVWYYLNQSLLVGGFKHEFYFPFHICDVILPIDELHHFSEGWLKTTSQIIINHH